MSTKISQLTAAVDITASDLMQIVDVEDGVMAPSGTNKKATAQLVANNLAKIVNDGAIITSNTSADAVRITQTGSGNALVVEDSTNPDATPFVVNASGNVGIGLSSPTERLHVDGSVLIFTGSTDNTLEVTNNTAGIPKFVSTAWRNGVNVAGQFIFNRSEGGVYNTHAIVDSEDQLGTIIFNGSDGVSFIPAASITSSCDGTPGINDMPGRLIFSTTADGAAVPAERMRITSAGNVGVGTTNPTAKLTVVDSTDIDALRITQTGSGNALVVEDSTNPDATPFVIDASGRVLNGLTAAIEVAHVNGGTVSPSYQQFSTGQGVASLITIGTGAAPQASSLSLAKARGTSESPEIVQDGDWLGGVTFQGYDGVNFKIGARIKAEVDGTPGSDDLPTRLVFGTVPDGSTSVTERMRITSAGYVGIGTTSPLSTLHVAGDLTVSSATTATSATAGTNGDVPAQVAGYLVVNINGTARKIPYYA